MSVAETEDAPSTVQPQPGVNATKVRFWMVWNKDGGAPTATHESYTQAAYEACRLAKKHPGHKFIVLEARRKFSVEAPEVTEAEQDAQMAAGMASAA